MIKRIIPIFFFGIATYAYADYSASPFVILFTTNTPTAPWSFVSSVTVQGGTLAVSGQAYVWQSTAPSVGQHLVIVAQSGGYNYLGWGGDQSGSSGGSPATLQSPATGPYDLAGVGAVMNSTGVYLSSGSISIGSNPATALLEIHSPDGTQQYIPVIVATPTARIFEIGNSSVTVSTATLLVQSTVSYGVPLSVGINGRTGDKPVSNAPIIAHFGGFDGSLTTKVVVRNHSSNVEMQIGAGNNLGLIGTTSSTPLQIRVGDSHNWSFDTAGNFTIRTTIAGGKLLVGTNNTNGSRFQLFDGSVTVTGSDAGLVVGSTQLVVHPGGGISVGTNTLGLGGFFSSATVRIEMNQNNNSGLLITTSSVKTIDFNGSSSSFFNVPVRVATGTSGVGGGIDATTYTSRGLPIVYSTWSAHAYDGFIVVATTGAIAANTTITITAAELGLSALGVQTCGELEGVNTSVVSVRVKSLAGLPTSFTVYNADIANTKNFTCIGAGFP